ncbi:MAG: hypothetical protein QOJ73_2342 [Streptosporangiaceae bacterium]|jgi:hypothetical protein|nr:hypothetical protein [Streptosporangiaceae bacterium]
MRRSGMASPQRCAHLPQDAPLLLSGAAPDAGILAALQCPAQTRSAHHARSAYLLGFIDLKQGLTRCPNREEQVGIHVAASGAATPVRAVDTLGVRRALEKELSCIAHQPRHLSSSCACRRC